MNLRLSFEHSHYYISINGDDFNELSPAPIDENNPAVIETFNCDLKINEKLVHRGTMPWFISEVKDKIMRGYADTSEEE